MNRDVLSAMADLLNDGGWNYSVFLKSYSVPLVEDVSTGGLVRAALGSKAVVERVQSTSVDDVLNEVKVSLSHAGDDGAGPDPVVLASQRFAELLSNIASDIEAISRDAHRVEHFWLKQGHPAYPVFWDFAFLFVGASRADVLVGSSSD
jgi:hypothetical protein